MTLAQAGKGTLKLLTDADGGYRYLMELSGIYQLSFTKLGYPAQALAVSISADSTQNVTLKGNTSKRYDLEVTVTDEAGSPISWVPLSLTDMLNKTYETDAPQGTNTFLKIPPGNYTLKVTKSPYLEQVVKITIGDNTKVHVVLKKAASNT